MLTLPSANFMKGLGVMKVRVFEAPFWGERFVFAKLGVHLFSNMVNWKGSIFLYKVVWIK